MLKTPTSHMFAYSIFIRTKTMCVTLHTGVVKSVIEHLNMWWPLLFTLLYSCRYGDSALPSAQCCHGVSLISPACQTILRSATTTQWSTRRSQFPFLPCVLHETDTHCVASCVTLTPDQTRLISCSCTSVTLVLCGCCNYFKQLTLSVLH